MSDEENDRFEEEQNLLANNFETIPHTPSAWEQDIYDVDEDPDPHGKNVNYCLISSLYTSLKVHHFQKYIILCQQMIFLLYIFTIYL